MAFENPAFPRNAGHSGWHPETREEKDPDGEECGDIVTAQQYDNFEFQLDWKIEPGGNSGIKYLVVEDRPANWEQAYLDYHLLSLKKSGKTEPPDRLKAREVEVYVDEFRAAAHR